VPAFPAPDRQKTVPYKIEIEKDRWDRFKPFLEIAGVVILGIYTTFTIKMYRANKESADAAKSAADTAARTLTTTIAQFHLQNRAYLIPGEPSGNDGGFGLLRIPIRNYGHVSAKSTTINGKFEHIGIHSLQNPDNRIISIRAQTDVPPGDAPTYEWLIFTPAMKPEIVNAINHNQETLRVLGTLSYDSGFGDIESIGICYGYQPIRHQWELCGGTTTVRLDDAPKKDN